MTRSLKQYLSESFDPKIFDEAKFFVSSETEEPEQIYFVLDAALKTECRYLDGFDPNGKRIKGASLKKVNGSWTTDF